MVADPFKFQQDTIKEGPCNVEKVVNKYWVAEHPRKLQRFMELQSKAEP